MLLGYLSDQSKLFSASSKTYRTIGISPRRLVWFTRWVILYFAVSGLVFLVNSRLQN